MFGGIPSYFYLLAAIVAVVFVAPSQGGRNVLCYYTNWPQYRPGQGKYTVNNIDPFLCTHIVFAFAQLQGNKLAPFEVNDMRPNGGAYKALNDLKRTNPKLTTLLAVGGWNHGPQRFVSMASTAQNRAEFVRTTIPLLRQHNFDGLDLDWEYPKETDKHNLAMLVMELRNAFQQESARTGNKRLLLAMAVAAGIENARAAYDIPAIDRYLDFYNLMTYDFHGAWEKTTGLAAPMRSADNRMSVVSTIQWYLQQGASKNKINLGLTFYARTWTLQTAGDNRLGAPAPKAGNQGPFTRTGGFLSYYEVCRLLQSGMTGTLDPLGQSMYGVTGDQFVTYDDMQTIDIKLNYIISTGLAGAMVWALDHDDFNNQFCGQGKYPLLTLVKNKMEIATTLPVTNGPGPLPVVTVRPVQPQITTQPPPILPQNGRRVVCYYTNWPQYRPGQGKYTVNNIDPFICTHIVFAFAQLQGNKLAPFEVNDMRPNGGAYKALNDLKRTNPRLTTLLAVGGWNHGPQRFVSMASTAQNRAEFVRTTIPLLRQHNFDGLDLDWEYPKEADKQNLAMLVMELRNAFQQESARTGNKRLLLAMAVAAGIENARAAYDIPAIDRYLDFYNLMTYDFHGAWEKTTGLAAPMRSADNRMSVVSTIQWYLQQGASKNKINLGLTFYARTWTLQTAGDNRLGAPAPKAGNQGPFTRTGGFLSYYEVCRLLQSGMTSTLDPLGQSMYGVTGDQFVTYDDMQTIDIKLNYILSTGLGGAMVWALDHDDFNNQFCGQGKYPLLTLVKNKMATGGTIQPVTQPPQPITNRPQPVTYFPQPVTNRPQPVTYFPQPVTNRPQPVTYWPQPVTNFPPVTQPTQRPVTQQPGRRIPRCTLTSGLMADPTSCTSYYICNRGYQIRSSCRGNEIFNAYSRQCEPKASSTYVCPTQG